MGQVTSRLRQLKLDSNDHRQLHPLSCQDLLIDIERMKIILKNDPQSLDRLQLTSENAYMEMLPLHIATYMGHINCTTFLINSGANVNALINTKYGNFSALEFAIRSGKTNINRYNIVKLLLENGAYPDSKRNSYSKTEILINVIEEQSNDIVKLLLEFGASTMISLNNQSSFTSGMHRNFHPLTKAVLTWNLEAFTLLLFHDASLHFIYTLQYTPIDAIPITSIPHFILLKTIKLLEIYDTGDKRSNIILRSLKMMQIYREFGGNLWEKQIYNNEALSVYEYLKVNDKNCEILEGFNIEFEIMANTPLSLKGLCRNVIKNHMGRNYYKNIQFLPLSKDVKNYLNFDDVHAS